MGVSVGGEVKRIGEGLTPESPWQHLLLRSLLGSLYSMKSLGMGPVSSPPNNFYTQGGLKKNSKFKTKNKTKSETKNKKKTTETKQTQTVQKEGREKHANMEKGRFLETDLF